eukprot:7320086-Prymnesium_polylepis.1
MLHCSRTPVLPKPFVVMVIHYSKYSWRHSVFEIARRKGRHSGDVASYKYAVCVYVGAPIGGPACVLAPVWHGGKGPRPPGFTPWPLARAHGSIQ